MDAVHVALLAALVVAASVAIIAWRRYRAALNSLSAAPIGLLRYSKGEWAANTVARTLLGLAKDRDVVSSDFLVGTVSPLHRAPFQAALQSLINKGIGFEDVFDTADSAVSLSMSGRKSSDGGIALWVVDQTASSRLAEQLGVRDHEAHRLRAILDRLPWPVWWRDHDGGLASGNLAYADIGASDLVSVTEQSDEGPKPLRRVGDPTVIDGRSVIDPFFPGGERAPGRLTQRVLRSGITQTESISVAREGRRRLYDVTETPIGSAIAPDDRMEVVGFARDLTGIEELQTTLASHIAAHDQVLEGLSTAIAVYGPDMRLHFFNAAFCRLWRLDPEDIEDRPTMGAVMDLLRERRVLPEPVDFRASKRVREALFTSLIEPEEGLLHLPDERTLRTTIGPHPLGGLVETFDDVTDRISLERSHNTLTAVQRMTLDSLYEGVCVFGSDGRVKLFNHVFTDLFDLDSGWLNEGPHIADIADRARQLFELDGDWETRREKIILAISDPTRRQTTIHLSNNRVLEVAYVPLPDGQCLVLVLDTTDSYQVTLALRERNAAFERADLLKAQFISSVSHELRSPLNAITGFAEILGSGMAGPLVDRQDAYVQDILGASRMLAGLIGEILDLAALQAGFLQLEEEPVDMRRLFAELQVSIDRSDSGFSSKADIQWSIACAEWIVSGDRERLFQAFRILLDVSRRVAGIETPIEFQVDDVGTSHRIRIKAEARAMSMNEIEQVLRPTSSVAQRSSTTQAGVGIALAKSLLEHYGGRLELGPKPDDFRYLDCIFDGPAEG